MKKAFKEWAFNLFTKRITVKVSKLPDDAKIEFLANKLLDELLSQGYEIGGSDCSEYVTLFTYNAKISVNYAKAIGQKYFKRLTKI